MMNDSLTAQLKSTFDNLTLENRLAIMSILVFLAKCDSKMNLSEQDFLNNYIQILDLSTSNLESFAVTTEANKSRAMSELKHINDHQKKTLIAIFHDLLTCDGNMNNIEYEHVIYFCGMIGIDEDTYVSVVEKNYKILESMMRNQGRPSQSTNNKSCYIATMAYQDINHPQVEYLRQVRDKRLLNYRLGQMFVKYYYKYSPTLVEYLRNCSKVNRVIKKSLDVLIASLKALKM